MSTCRFARTLSLITAARSTCNANTFLCTQHVQRFSTILSASRSLLAIKLDQNKNVPAVHNYSTAVKTDTKEHEDKPSAPQEAFDDLFKQIDIEIKGQDKQVLASYEFFTSMAADELGVTLSRIYTPPRVITRLSLLKSVFVHKKHFHQYEIRTNYRIFEVKHITGSTASTFLEYIQRNLPAGVAMKVTKHQLHQMPSHLNVPRTNATRLTSTPEPQDKEAAPELVAGGDAITRDSAPVTRLIVKPIARTVSADDISSFFTANGIAVGRTTKKEKKSFAHIELLESGDLDKALALTGSEFNGSQIKVEKDVMKAKSRLPNVKGGGQVKAGANDKSGNKSSSSESDSSSSSD